MNLSVCRLFFQISLIVAFLVTILTAPLSAQPDLPGWDRTDECIRFRSEITEALKTGDMSRVDNLADSLQALSDSNFNALYWDERALLWHAAYRYRDILTESENYTRDTRQKEAWAEHPPDDSLFAWADAWVYAYRAELHQQLDAAAGLSAAERNFLHLHLDYALRDHSDSIKQMRRNFLKTFPHSSHRTFVREWMPLPPKEYPFHFGIDAQILNLNWQGPITFAVSSGWGFSGGLSLAYKRWVLSGRMDYASLKISRPIRLDNDVWKRGDRALFYFTQGELGYSCVNASKIKVTPAITLGQALIGPPSPDDEGEYPDDQTFFYDFTGFGYGASCTVDIHWKPDQRQNEDDTEHSLKLRLAGVQMPFAEEEPLLSGRSFLLSVGYGMQF